MEDEFLFIYQDKYKLIKLFALSQGWKRVWLAEEQETLEHLYNRKMETIDVAIQCIKYETYPMDTESLLNHEFLKSFFNNFSQVQIMKRPDITLLPKIQQPKIIEAYIYEDAWKYHIQALVIMENLNERVDYLYNYVPKYLKEEFRKHTDRKQEIRDKLAN